MESKDLRQERMRYVKAHHFIQALNKTAQSIDLSRQEYKALRMQAISGDVDGAYKSLGKIMSDRLK